MNDLIVSVRLKADGSGLVTEVRGSAEELRKLGASGQNATRGVDEAQKATARAGKAQAEYSGQLKAGIANLGAFVSASQAAAAANRKTADSSREVAKANQDAAASTDRLVGLLKGVGALIGVSFAASQVKQFLGALISTADQMRQLEGRLSLVVTRHGDLAAVQTKLFDIAQRNLAPLAETTTLYTRVATALGDYERNGGRALKISEAIGQALRISGASSAESASTMLQFAQALASGVLRGDEFNSMMEAAPRLAKALADGLGVATGELRAMAEAGDLTRDRVIAALESQADALKKQADALPKTVGGAWQQLENEVKRYIGQVDSATGASSTLAEALSKVAKNVDAVGHAVGELMELALFVGGGAVLLSVATRLGAVAAGLVAVEKGIVGITAAQALFVGGAALARLEKLSMLGKGGLLGAALWGGVTVGEWIRDWDKGTGAITRGLDAIFAAADRAVGTTPEDRAAAAEARGYDINRQAATRRAVSAAGFTSTANLPDSLTRTKRAPDFTTRLSTAGFEARQRSQAEAEQRAQEQADRRESAIADVQKLYETSMQDQAEMHQQLAEMEAKAAAEEAERIDKLRRKRRDAYMERVQDLRGALRTEVEAEDARNATVQQDLQDALDRQLISEAEARDLRERAEKDHQKRVTDIQLDATREVREKLEREQERQAEMMARPFENAVQGIQSAFTGAFESIFSGGVHSFGDLAKSIKQVFIHLAAEVASLLVFRPIVGGILGAAGLGGIAGQMGMGTSAGAAAGGSSSSGGLLSTGLSLTTLFRGMQSEFGAGLGISIADGLGLGPMGQSFFAGAGLNAPWAVAGGVLNSILGIDNGIGSTLGGLAGGGIGTLFTSLGSFGGPVGAVAGTVLGGLIQGLFGGKPKRKVSAASVYQGELGKFLVKDKGGPAGSAAAKDVGGLLAQELNALTAQGYSLNFNGGFGFTEVTNAKKAGGQPFYLDFLPGSIRPKDFQRTGFDSAQALVDAVVGLVKRKGIKETPEEKAAKEQAAAMIKGATTTNEFLEQVKAVIAQFKELRGHAKELGLSLADIKTAEKNQLGSLKTSAVSGIRSLVQQGRSILGIPALESLKQQLSYGDLATTSPAAQLAAARGDLTQTARAALAGNADAIQAFPTLAQNVLGLARETYASGEGYQSVFREVNSTLNRVLDKQKALEASLVSGITITLQQTSAEQIAEIKTQTKELVAGLKAIEARLKKVGR